jgi:hypothetical protein
VAEPSAVQITPPPELAALHTAIHALVHAAMAEGRVPTGVEVGWRQYGLLYRGGPDGERPRSVLDLPLLPVGEPEHLAVRCTRDWI